MKKPVLFYLFFFLYFSSMAQSIPKLIYFGDPMCSWCYGFSPEFSKAVEALKGEGEMKLVMGGLRPHNTETMEILGDFLKYHWGEVEKRSGQPFSYDILNRTDFVYDTEPACRAVVTMRKMSPEKEFVFYKEIQKAFYYENMDTNLAETFGTVAERHGVDKEEFLALFLSEEMKEAVEADFLYTQKMRVRSFPTVMLQVGEEYYPLAKGYTSADSLIEDIKNHLK